MRVQDLMSHPAITCHVHDDLDVPARLMWDHDCGVIPVVNDDGTLIGMITDRDICMAAYTQGRSLDEIEVSIVMAMQPISAHPDQDIEEIERMMAEHQVRRLAVVGDDGKPIGVLSLNDLAVEGVRSGTRFDDASSRIARTLAAVSAHRPAAGPAPDHRGSEPPKLEIVPDGWFEMFVDPYPVPTRAPQETKPGAP
jgi:CBS domain-containing protein